MEIPNKIYLEVLSHSEHKEVCKDVIKLKRTLEDDIEYVSTDAFIEKALSWLKNHYRDYMHNPTGKRLEAFFGGDMCNDFETYMKGE